MKKKQTPYLDLYNECCKLGRLPHAGLCECIFRHFGITYHNQFKEIFEPDYNFEYNIISYAYWGADSNKTLQKKHYDFGPTRQNILLLMAVMNDEL